MDTLPETIGDLSALTDLRLDSNKLASIPIELGYLTSLTSVALDNNPLRSPPPEIIARGEQETVHYLHGFTMARKTFELDLTGLRLSEFPEQANFLCARACVFVCVMCVCVCVCLCVLLFISGVWS
jgi:Leucine-rich repeat (LRR) protein